VASPRSRRARWSAPRARAATRSSARSARTSRHGRSAATSTPGCERSLEGEYDATVLAAAGLERLGIGFAQVEALDLDSCPPAPGQGALAIQCRTDDTALRARLAPLDDAATRAAVTSERALLAALGASCALALGAYARCIGGRVILDAAFDDGGLRRSHAEGVDPLAVAAEAAAALRVAAASPAGGARV